MSKTEDDTLFILPNVEKDEIKIHSGQSGSITPEARGESREYEKSHLSGIIKKMQQVAGRDIARQKKSLKILEQMLALVKKQYESQHKLIKDYNEQYSKLSKDSEELVEHSNALLEINKQALTGLEKQIKTLTGKIQTCQEKLEIIIRQESIKLPDKALYVQLYHETGQSGVSVSRFAMNPGKLNEMVGQKLGNSLHLAEQILFDEALSVLDKSTSAKALGNKKQQKSPNNVVLVDIFAREKDGTIKNENGKPETHTVALWKKENGKIILIDPSNVTFSSGLISSLQFLAKNRNNKAPESTDVGQLKPNIEQPEEKHQEVSVQSIEVTGKKIYKPDEFEQMKVGRLATDSRDCIDIAVKIGFVLNDLQSQGTKFKDLDSTMLSQITNQSTVLSKIKKMNPKKIRTVLSSESFRKISRGLRSSDSQRRKSTVEKRDSMLKLEQAQPKPKKKNKQKKKKKTTTGSRIVF